MADHKHGPNTAPAVGRWRCRPTEFDIGGHRAVYVFVRWIGRLLFPLIPIGLYLLLPNLGSQLEPWRFSILVLSPLLLMFFMRFPSRRITARTDGKFYVDVTFAGTEPASVTGAVIEYSITFGSDRLNPQPRPEKPYPLQTPQGAAALQNLLPWLHQLQRTVGDHGHLFVNGDASARTFRCARSWEETTGLWLQGAVMIIFAALNGATVLVLLSGTSLMAWQTTLFISLSLLGFAIGLLRALYVLHLLRLPKHLSLTVVRRPRAEDVVHVTWYEYHSWRSGVHERWAVLSDAQGLNYFCDRLADLRVQLQHLSIDDPEPT